jgi:hypothetical protein
MGSIPPPEVFTVHRRQGVRVDLTPAQNPANFHFDEFTPDQLERLKALVLEADFQDADTLRMQVRVACDTLRPAKGPRRFSYHEIGRFLGVSASTVNHQWGATQAPVLKLSL